MTASDMPRRRFLALLAGLVGAGITAGWAWLANGSDGGSAPAVAAGSRTPQGSPSTPSVSTTAPPNSTTTVPAATTTT
ncbi:MAG: hypothetical protein OER12_02430, partial [Acidimicrobiia bacterium]|nr:hypothetical protein [Acidimicrobiia bacterium]